MRRWNLAAKTPGWKRLAYILAGLACSAAAAALSALVTSDPTVGHGIEGLALRGGLLGIFGSFVLAGLAPTWVPVRAWWLRRALSVHDGLCIACGAKRASPSPSPSPSPSAGPCDSCGETLPRASELAWTFGEPLRLFLLAGVSFASGLASLGVMFGAGRSIAREGVVFTVILMGLAVLMAGVGAVMAVVFVVGLVGPRDDEKASYGAFAGDALEGGTLGLRATFARSGVQLGGSTATWRDAPVREEAPLVDPALEALARVVAAATSEKHLRLRERTRVEWSAGDAPARERPVTLGAAYRAESAHEASAAKTERVFSLLCPQGTPEARARALASVGITTDGPEDAVDDERMTVEDDDPTDAHFGDPRLVLANLVERARSDDAYRAWVTEAAAGLAADEVATAALHQARGALRALGAA